MGEFLVFLGIWISVLIGFSVVIAEMLFRHESKQRSDNRLEIKDELLDDYDHDYEDFSDANTFITKEQFLVLLADEMDKRLKV